jgi:hypothetical protein
MSSMVVFGVTSALASLLSVNIGSAENAQPLHKGPWPIRNGRNYQPTAQKLKALHLEGVTHAKAIDCSEVRLQPIGNSAGDLCRGLIGDRED